MECGVSPAQIRSNAFGCIPINLSGMQTRHGMKLLVIGDHRSNRRQTAHGDGEKNPRSHYSPAGVAVVDGYEEGEREREDVLEILRAPRSSTDTTVLPFDPRLNTAALLMLPAGRRGIIPPWKSTNRDYAGLNCGSVERLE